ncbi:hypothetical protein BK799_31995 [Rhodococcus sp. D-1]|nr:hypothetical protein BK799_31995 [Rhodococcus sp. D-1]
MVVSCRVEGHTAPSVLEATLRELASVLPHLVSEAVQCPEEPYDGALRPGDVDIRFREFGPFDRGGLPVVIEVRSKWFESRAVNRQERVDVLHEEITDATGLGNFGIYLALPSAVWAQTD